MKYFTNIRSIDELKSAYRKLAFELHPDKGGDKKAFQEMHNEYEKVFEEVKNYFKNAKGEYYHKENDEKPNEFSDLIDALMKLKDIKIEIIGTFVWVSGKTKQHEEKLKELGFRHQEKKRNWCKSPKGYRKRSKRKYTMNQIRDRFGVSGSWESEKQMELSV